MKTLLWRAAQGSLVFTGTLTAKAVKDVIALNDGFVIGAFSATNTAFWSIVLCGAAFCGVAIGLFLSATTTKN